MRIFRRTVGVAVVAVCVVWVASSPCPSAAQTQAEKPADVALVSPERLQPVHVEAVPESGTFWLLQKP
ncbi:MAG: hypothetical protein N2379_10695, partial [Verrucomicrobiae bacterium]|nr:hypothetical protein [Verrucomicrobiae bacterium]